jgi:hypothetical protein
MGDLGPYVEDAVLHEAGHILCGKAVGFPALGLDLNIGRDPATGKATVGDFATLTMDPPDEELPKLDSEIRAALLVKIAGGVAGQIFSKTKPSHDGTGDDRRRFDRIKSPDSNVTFDYVAKESQSIFRKRKKKYWKLVALIRTKYMELQAKLGPNPEPGRYQLVSEQDLEDLLNQKD